MARHLSLHWWQGYALPITLIASTLVFWERSAAW